MLNERTVFQEYQQNAALQDNAEYAIETQDLVKVFPGTIALKGVNIKFKKGTVIGLLGKNGSGKSTLINVLCGMYPKTSGKVLYEGKEEIIRSVGDSEEQGIRFISQEPYLMDDLSIAENIAFREKEHKKPLGYVQMKQYVDEARQKLDRIHLDVDPEMQTEFLKVSEKQLVLTVREVLSTGAKVIAFDEVANALSQNELKSVFKLINEEKEKGKTFIYISHEIDEVFSICDSVVVIRDGEVVLQSEIGDVTSAELKKAIAGREIDESQKVIESREEKEVVLQVRNLENEKLKDVSFDLHEGEVIGLFGLRGSGRTELVKTLFGLMDAHKGRAIYRGKDILHLPVHKRCEIGIGFVPEDRSEGVMDCRPIRDNLYMSSMKKYLNKARMFDTKRENETYEKIKREFDVKADSIDSEIAYLSGGNKQKIMFARCRTAGSSLYLIDEGTRGIDIGAKFEIYDLIRRLADGGDSFIYTSSDLEEICQVSNRIFILHNGQIMAELQRNEFSIEKLLHYADGNRQERGELS